MALRFVTKKPNRNVVVFLLLEGGNFQDYVDGKAVLRATHKTTVPLTTAQVRHGVERVDPTPFTTPDPRFPTAQWYPGWAFLECESFNTPTEDLSPEEYSIDGPIVYYINDLGQFEKRPLAEVEIVRGGNNVPVKVQPRK